MLLCILLSCKKEAAKLEVKTAGSDLAQSEKLPKRTNTLYYSMLQVDQSDPTGNTYFGSYGDFAVKVSQPVYDDVSYPNNVNGIPAIAEVALTSNGTLDQSYTKYGATYLVFTPLVQPSFYNPTQIHAAIQEYQTLFTYEINNSGTIPDFSSFVAASYPMNNGQNVAITKAKLIRVTAGTHWALADVDYPQPTPVIQPPVSSTFFCTFTLNNTTYSLSGSSGNLTTLEESYPVSTDNPIKSVLGTYTNINTIHGVTTCDVNVTVYYTFGNPVKYVGTAQLGI